MKRILLALALALVTFSLIGQELTSTSESVTLDFGFPSLKANDDLVFIDDNENGQIDPGEACAIIFTLANKSQYPAQDVLIKPSEINGLQGLIIPPQIKIGSLTAGASRKVEVGIIAEDSLETGTANFSFAIFEGDVNDQASGTIVYSIPVNQQAKEEEEDDSE